MTKSLWFQSINTPSGLWDATFGRCSVAASASSSQRRLIQPQPPVQAPVYPKPQTNKFNYSESFKKPIFITEVSTLKIPPSFTPARAWPSSHLPPSGDRSLAMLHGCDSMMRAMQRDTKYYAKKWCYAVVLQGLTGAGPLLLPGEVVYTGRTLPV